MLEGAEEALASIQAEREHPRRTGQGEHPLKTGREVVAAWRKHKASNREKTERRSLTDQSEARQTQKIEKAEIGETVRNREKTERRSVTNQSESRQNQKIEKAEIGETVESSLGSESTWRRTVTPAQKIWQRLGSQSKSREKKGNPVRRWGDESTHHYDGRRERTGGGRGHPLFWGEREEEYRGENEGYDGG